jgi:hypothetical protein
MPSAVSKCGDHLQIDMSFGLSILTFGQMNTNYAFSVIADKILLWDTWYIDYKKKVK